MTHYHDYQRVSENHEGLVEVCKECGKRLITKKDKQGRMDNATYAREHIRDIAQPTGATKHIFDQFYDAPKN